MARTGRPRKKADLKVVKGNFAKGISQTAAVRADEKRGALVLSADAPPRPDHLDKMEAQIWDKLVTHLEKIGTLQRCDEGQLAAYCGTYARYIRNKKTLEAFREKNEGSDFFTTDGRHGEMIRVHPAIGVIERCEKALKSMATEFGMTPSSRKAMGYDPKQLFLPFSDDRQKDDPTEGIID